METDDLIAYEFVTPNGDWSWSLGSIVSCQRNCLVDIVQWADASGGALRGRDATLYYEAVREAEECSQAAKRLGEEVRVIRAQIMQQREQAEENARLARERLLAAQHAVRTIDNSHLREMRSYRTPPTLVKETLAAVLHLLRQSPVPETWDNVQRLIRRSDFIQNVLNFDPGDEDDALNRSVTTHYLSNPAMTVENVNLASRAAGPLLQWLFAKIGATTASVELRTFDKEIHEASAQFKHKSERIGLLQTKSVAAAKRAEELKVSAAQSKMSFRKLPTRAGGMEASDSSTREWTKDLSSSANLTILTSSILCNFGMEQGAQRSLSQEDEDMIVDAHHAARRDNNERLAFALESLAAKEKEMESLHSEVLETTRQNEELLLLLEEERADSRNRVNVAREDAATIEQLRFALKESSHGLEARIQRAVELEETNARLVSDLDLLRATTAEEQEILQSENLALRTKTKAMEAKNDELAAALDAASANVIALKSSVEQDHLGFMDDAVRRDNAWRAERLELERNIEALQRDVVALTASRDSGEAAIAHESTLHRQEQDALGTRINALELELEDTQAALSSAEAQNELLTQRLGEMQSTASADVTRLEEMVSESEAVCASLQSSVARLSDALLHQEAAATESARSTEVLKERLAEAHNAFQKELQDMHALHEATSVALRHERDGARAEAERIATLQKETDSELETLKHSMQTTVHEAGSEMERISEAWRLEQERTRRLEEEIRQLQSIETTLRSQLNAAMAESAHRAQVAEEESRQHRLALQSLESQRLHEQEQIKHMQLELDNLHTKEASLQSAVDVSRTEKSLVAREMEALNERHRLELSSIQAQLEGMQQPREAASTPPRQLVDASEVVEMQQRLERELQYMQSVHSGNVAQHVQLQRELRSRADGLMKEAEQVRGQLRQTEERVGDLQASVEEKGEALRVAHIKLAASEGQNAQMLEALQASALERKQVDEEVLQLQAALDAASQTAAELQALTASQEKALEAFHAAQLAGEEVDEENQTQIDNLRQELEVVQDALRAREAEMDVLEKEMESRVAAEQDRQKGLQHEVDALCEKLTENNRNRLENSNELVEAVTRLQQEKRDAVEDLMRQLEASWEADDESRKHIRILRSENEALAARVEQSTNEVHALEQLRNQESKERQERLNELVELHQHQLQALRGERDDAIRKLHAQEIARSDLDFTVAELRSKLARYQTDTERDGPLITHEQTQLDELRARLHVLTRELDSDHQLLREKDAQVHDLNRRVVEYELLAVEQDQRRHETAAALRERDAALWEREAVLERERVLRNDRANKHRQELEHLHRRVASLEDEQSAVARSTVMVAPPPPSVMSGASRRRGSPAALNPASLDALKAQNLSSGWYPANGPHDTPSIVSSRRAADDSHEGAHLVVLIRTLEDLQHNGKPLKAQEVFVKLKTIKEKHRSSTKPLRNCSSDIGERCAFQLADPAQDVVHVSVFARTPGSLFDNELHVGDVDLSMATLSRGVDRARRVVIAQDARTKKARVAGYAQVVLRSDDFGSLSPPNSKEVAAEAQRYAATQQRFAVDFPEKLHAIDVYMAGEAAAIEEADRRHR